MTDREGRRRRLREKSKQAAAKADEILGDELARIRGASRADLEALRPKVSDPEAYAQLLSAVEEATARNESIAQLRARLQQAGERVVAIAKEVARLVP